MNITEKAKQASAFISTSSKPIPLLLDMLRLKVVRLPGRVQGSLIRVARDSSKWFTVLENVIREDYFTDGVHLMEGATVVDIGANFGLFLFWPLRKSARLAVAMAFEPSLSVFGRLVRNIELNNATNIQAFSEAISDKDGYLDLKGTS